MQNTKNCTQECSEYQQTTGCCSGWCHSSDCMAFVFVFSSFPISHIFCCPCVCLHKTIWKKTRKRGGKSKEGQDVFDACFLKPAKAYGTLPPSPNVSGVEFEARCCKKKQKKTLKESKSLPMQLLHQYVERCRLTVFWRVND